MSADLYIVKDARPAPEEPYNFKYDHGVSTVIMPNGSAVCVSQNAPIELQISMTKAWAEAWAAEQDGDSA